MNKKELKRKIRIENKKRFKEWSKLVKERDNFKCVFCDETKMLNAHHIINRQNEDLRFDINNGITLCSKHHRFSFSFSAHQNSFIFVVWLMLNRREQYDYLVNYLKNKHVIITEK